MTDWAGSHDTEFVGMQLFELQIAKLAKNSTLTDTIDARGILPARLDHAVMNFN